MPRYDYVCDACGNEFEREFSMADMKHKLKCPSCGKMARRAIGMVNAIIRHRYLDQSRKGRGKFIGTKRVR